MSTGFIYVVTTLTSLFEQKQFCNVPTVHAGRLYFGPCKRPMRPRMQPGDYVFGLSPSGLAARRVVFMARLAERLTFANAFVRYPDLRGPEGPIHVRPSHRPGPFPRSHYEHIEGAMHAGDWEEDLSSPAMDAFFVCNAPAERVGEWLGRSGPVLDEALLDFLKTCSVHGKAGPLGGSNPYATLSRPIAYGGLFTGLHLETPNPERFVALCRARIYCDIAAAVPPQARAPGATSGGSPPRRADGPLRCVQRQRSSPCG